MKKLITLGCLATVFTMGYTAKAKAQDDSPAPDQGDRKVRIEITTREDGSTQRVTHELDLSDGQALEDALRELGVFDEIGVINDGENMVIELKRLSEDGGMLKDMCMALTVDPEWETTGGFLGVYGGNWNESTCEDDKKKNKNNTAIKEGACITSVIDDTPAQKAGLTEGDVITMVNDEKVGSFSELAEKVSSHEPGEEVQLTYYRDGKKNTVKVTLAEQKLQDKVMFYDGSEGGMWNVPDMEDFDWQGFAEGEWSTEPHPFLGIDGEDADGGGARITEVIEGTNAESMGLNEGDVIKTFNGVNVLGFEPLAEMIGEMEPGASVEIEIERDGDRSTLHGVLGEQDMPTWVSPPTPPGAPLPPGAPAPFMYRMPRMDEGERDQLRYEMDALREEMDRLRRDLRGEVTREMRVVIATIELTKEEADVLKNKGVTGLDAAWSLPGLRCFPNPSSGSFHLEFDVPERGDLNVDIHDAQGERVYHETITGFKGRYERTLDLNDRADGTYFLVLTQNGKALARKLVKQ